MGTNSERIEFVDGDVGRVVFQHSKVSEQSEKWRIGEYDEGFVAEDRLVFVQERRGCHY